MSDLHFSIESEIVSRRTLLLTAMVGGDPVTSSRLLIGSESQRKSITEKWMKDERLHNGCAPKPEAILAAIEAAEQASRREIERLDDEAADAAIAELEREGEEGEAKKKPQALTLMAIAKSASLWHDQNFDSWATITIDGHNENWPTKSKQFRSYLARLYYAGNGTPPGSQAMQDALITIGGMAMFDGEQHRTHARIAGHDGAILIDLCDEEWRVVRIAADGWSIENKSPIKFRRARGMKSLPVPERGGDLRELRRFINVESENDYILLVAWLIGALRPTGPYPVLALNGEQGSAKSSACRALRSLIDPSEALLRSEPRDERDLVIAANNGWVIGLDNLSRIQNWCSDALCRIATGGGFATRELYTDCDETIFSSQRPILVNGIGELATRSDLLDRSICVTLPTIPDEKRIEESNLWSQFSEAHPRLLGALCDAAVVALRNVGSVRLDRLPRMADFATWVSAAEGALPWAPGGFMDAYVGNRDAANTLAIEAVPFAGTLAEWVAELPGGTWTGSASELLAALADRVPEGTRKRDGWPTRPNTFANDLRRIAPNLRKQGIDVQFERTPGGGRRRIISVRHLERDCNSSSPIVPSSRNRVFDPENRVEAGRSGTIRDDAGTIRDDQKTLQGTIGTIRDDLLQAHSNLVLKPTPPADPFADDRDAKKLVEKINSLLGRGGG